MANEKKFSNKIIAKEKTKYYLDDDTADVHFVFKVDEVEQRIGAHKILLASGSPVFHTMFYGTLKEKSDVKISDSSAKGFMDFLSLFYSEEVKINKANVFEIMDLTNKYDIPEGMDMCEQYLMENTTISDVCTHFDLAIKYNLNKLHEYCESKIPVHAVEVLKTDGFIGSSKDVLESILKLDNKKCSEMDIFNGCLDWAENACEKNGIDITEKQNLRHELGDCFYLIPFSTMKIEYFSKIATENRTFFKLDDVIDIMALITSDGQMDPSNKFKRNPTSAPKFYWDESHLIKCLREKQIRAESSILRNEYTVFTTSSKILLGGFRFFDFLNKTYSDNKLSAVVCITKENETEPLDKFEFALYAKSMISVSHEIRLKKPIVIIPHTKYNIHVDFSVNTTEYKNDDDEIEGWSFLKGQLTLSSLKIGENISIKFHKHSDHDNYGPKFSIISEFNFNQL